MDFSTTFMVVAIVAIFLQVLMLYAALVGYGPGYRVTTANREALDSDEFALALESLADAKLNHRSSAEVITNGENFYPAELQAIRNATRSINMEAYIFHPGRVADQFLQALTERAAAGVIVSVVVDAVGSARTLDEYFHGLVSAGGRFAWYHPLRRWWALPTFNNRTHRELLIVDGTTGFIGGAGIADQWQYGSGDNPPWRDTVVRVTGDIVPNLQGTFVENWLEVRGELLTGPAFFPTFGVPSQSAMMVVNSTPSPGGSTRARVLFQMLVASARKNICITTPYFLPDTSLCSELVKAIHERGVTVQIITPGHKSDHILTRSSSRRLYGPLLQAGAQIYEYEPAMIHAKVLTIDGLWSVVGSTNFDNRSFGINDEVNLAVRDPDFAARLEADFQRDKAQARAITLDSWERRPFLERVTEWAGWMIQRQQ